MGLRRKVMNFKDTFQLKDTTYDQLKYIVQIVLPAVATFIGVVGIALGITYTEVVVVIFTAVNVLLGTILGVSSRNYYEDEMENNK
jgi:hypothetical protein